MRTESNKNLRQKHAILLCRRFVTIENNGCCWRNSLKCQSLKRNSKSNQPHRLTVQWKVEPNSGSRWKRQKWSWQPFIPGFRHCFLFVVFLICYLHLLLNGSHLSLSVYSIPFGVLKKKLFPPIPVCLLWLLILLAAAACVPLVMKRGEIF